MSEIRQYLDRDTRMALFFWDLEQEFNDMSYWRPPEYAAEGLRKVGEHEAADDILATALRYRRREAERRERHGNQSA